MNYHYYRQSSSLYDNLTNQIDLDSVNYSIIDDVKNSVNNEKLSDVTFLVGENKKMIHGHKLILSYGSPVFEKMFHGEFEHKSDAIEINDLTETGFLNMLRYIHGYEIDFDLSELCESYKALDKYLVYGHQKKISEYIEKKLNKSNCFVIYDQLVKIKKNNDLLNFIENFIQTYCSVAFFSEPFLEIDKETLIKLLNLDCLNLDEFNVLKACSNWVNNKVGECDDGNKLFDLKQEKFNKIKNFIKFSELNVNELCMSSKFDVLSFQEMGALLIGLNDKSKGKLIITCKTKRRSIRPFTVEGNGTYYNKVFNESFLTRILTVNRKIMISSISTYIKSRFKSAELSIFENGVNIDLKYEKREFDKKWGFHFTPCLEIEPEKSYTLTFSLDSTNFRHNYFSDKKHFKYSSKSVNYSVTIHLKHPYESIESKFHLIRKIDFFDCSVLILSS